MAKNTNNTNGTNATKVTIYGTITSSFFGATKFSKDDMYRVSVKIDGAELEKLVDASKEMYKDSPASFIPKWFKDEKTEYINFKSKFDIPTISDDDKECTTLNDFIKKYGNINGSKCGIALKVADGAIYPIAIKIYKFANTDFSDLFDEELPF